MTNAKDGETLLYTLSGGMSYGTTLPDGNADMDFTYVTVMPMEHYLGLDGDGQVDSVQVFEQRGERKLDLTYHEVTKFFRMTAGGNPATFPFLFQNDPNMAGAKADKLWRDMVLFNRTYFCSKAPYHAFRGMALQELARFEKSLGTEKPAWKAAMHSLRLMRMLVEYLDTGKMTVCRVGLDQENLWAVRKGEVYAADVMTEVDELVAKAEALMATTDLPSRCNNTVLSQLLVQLKLAFWE